jgi:AcrR family transcriptional regulator
MNCWLRKPANPLLTNGVARSKFRPRTKPAEERREELMNAAQRLFLKHGVSAVTIEQITRAAGVAKGTFYLYFSSKDGILAALADRFAAEHLRRVKEALASLKEGDWKGKLAAWAVGCASGYLDAIELHDILFYGSRPATREGLVDNIVIDSLEELLREGMAAGAWSVDDPRFIAVFLFSGLHAVVDDAYGKEKRVNRARLLERAEQLFFRAVNLAAP